MIASEYGAKHSPPGDRWPPDCLEGVPPVCVPGPPLIYHISAPCQPNEEFSTWILIIFDVLSDGIYAVSWNSRGILKYLNVFDIWWKIMVRSTLLQVTGDRQTGHRGFLQSANPDPLWSSTSHPHVNQIKNSRHRSPSFLMYFQMAYLGPAVNCQPCYCW